MSRPVTRRTVLATMGAGVAATFVPGVASRAGAAPPLASPAQPAPLRADDLADDSAVQPRWLSQSGSRIVVNPYDVLATSSPVEQSNRPDVPLNVAYYAHDGATRLDDLLMVNVRPSGEAPGYGEAEVGFVDGCTRSADWTDTGSLTMTASGSVLKLTSVAPGEAYASRAATVDLDRFPLLRINVPQVTGRWSLSLVDAAGAVVTVQDATSAAGVFFYDVAASTSWQGTVALTVRLQVIGEGSSISVDEVRLQSVPTVPAVFEDDFDSLDPGWTRSAAAATSVSDGRLQLTCPNTTGTWYGYVTRTVTVDLDKYPILKVKVDSVGQYWAVKVNTGQAVDTIVQNNSTELGIFSYDLQQITGWTGVQRLSIRLFVNGFQTTASFDSVVLQARTKPWLEQAADLSTTWYPHQLPFEAGYSSGPSITGTDFFASNDSLTRCVEVTGKNLAGRILLSGQYFGAPSYDAATRTLTFTLPELTYSVALPSAIGAPRFYADRDSWSCGGPVLDGDLPAHSGFWQVSLPAYGSGPLRTQIGVGLAVSTEPGDTAARRAVDARSADRAQITTATRQHIDALLAVVPHPIDFSLQAVAADNVDPGQIRAMYYRAWVFLAHSVLPPQPEIGQTHALLATGKPALYLHGPAGAHASASWDSEIGIQFLAYLDADTAWDALEGLLSLVDDTGLLPGEFLPAREAQTAWALTCLTGDDRRLAAIYPSLRRLLVYKQDHPKYSGDTNANNKDLPFVAHALIDTDYAIAIARRLRLDDDATFWSSRYTALNTDMLGWFWKTPDAQPPQVYDPVKDVSAAGNVMSATPALHVRTVDATHSTGLLQRFDSLYEPVKPLAGFGVDTNDVRYGITSYTIYGLLDRGHTERATTLSNAILLGTVSTHMFAERYQWDEQDGIFGAGQRPSLFGVANVIDAVWMNNGYRMDGGVPSFVLLPATAGGLTNLRFQGRQLAVHADARQQRVTLTGDLINSDAHSQSFTLGLGETLPLPARYSTVRFT